MKFCINMPLYSQGSDFFCHTVHMTRYMIYLQGMMSGSSGAGLMAGPAIGGVLYKVGNIRLHLSLVANHILQNPLKVRLLIVVMVKRQSWFQD